MKQFRNVDPTCEMVVVQFDQELGRCPTTVNMTPCVCPGGKYWLSYGLPGTPRCLSAGELAMLQGIGKEEVDHFGLHEMPPSLLQNCAGNSFSGAVCMSIFMVVLMAWDR